MTIAAINLGGRPGTRADGQAGADVDGGCRCDPSRSILLDMYPTIFLKKYSSHRVDKNGDAIATAKLQR